MRRISAVNKNKKKKKENNIQKKNNILGLWGFLLNPWIESHNKEDHYITDEDDCNEDPWNVIARNCSGDMNAAISTSLMSAP